MKSARGRFEFRLVVSKPISRASSSKSLSTGIRYFVQYNRANQP
jgi:hypothetical protein